MVNARGLGRLGGLAVGLGIGAVVAATAGVASADSSTDPFSWIGGIDLGDLLSAPAQTTSALDMQVSIDGFDLFPAAGNTATAVSGLGDIAIAIGNGANANAGAGTVVFDIFDFAFADGTNSFAEAGFDGSLDSATAVGTNSSALSEGFSLDSATVVGDGSSAQADGSLDTATALGTGSSALTSGPAFDTATAVGTGSSAGTLAAVGDLATALGTNNSAVAGFGSLDTATAVGTNSNATAQDGGGNFASVLGDNGLAEAGGSGPVFTGFFTDNFDIASVLGTGSTADAGANLTTAGNFDLAAAFGDMLNATGATGGNFLADILPML